MKNEEYTILDRNRFEIYKARNFIRRDITSNRVYKEYRYD